MSQVRVMTWNLENLFLPGQDGGPDSEAAFQAKLAALAAVIDQVAPDLAAVQEVGPDPALARLQARLTHQLPHAAIGDPDDRQIRVAILSAHPLADIATARVNLSEADSFGNHCVVAVSCFGSLIQTAVGSAGGVGGLRTKRSGCPA